MRRDEVRVDREPEDPKASVEVVLPDRRVPLRRPALQHLGAPDVVDEHVDVSVLVAETHGQPLDLRGIEMVDAHRDAGAAERP